VGRTLGAQEDPLLYMATLCPPHAPSRPSRASTGSPGGGGQAEEGGAHGLYEEAARHRGRGAEEPESLGCGPPRLGGDIGVSTAGARPPRA
jgi:hypothetical protein